MNTVAIAIRTMLYLLFMLLAIFLIDILLPLGIALIINLKWYWFVLLVGIFGAGIIGLFSVIIIAPLIGLTSLIKPHPQVAGITLAILSVINFIYLTYSTWAIGEYSFGDVIGKIIITYIWLHISYMLLIAGLSLGSTSDY